ncbi:MAG: DHHW family protein [Ruminococcus sp.]
MKKIFNIISTVIFLAVIFGSGTAMLILPQKDFSENENRYLEKNPEFSLNGLFKGEYIPKLENAFNDQFPMRDSMISMRSEVLRLSGNRDIGGAYLGNDDFLFEKLTDSNILTQRFERNLNAINRFTKEFEGETYVMLVPSASDVLYEKLPLYNSQYDTEKAYSKANELLNGCSFIDLRDTLGNIGDDSYYKTDHHWTTMGAGEAYRIWCGLCGLKYSEKPLTELSDTFRGTLYSKVLSPDCAYDRIFACSVSDDISVYTNGTPSSVYDMEKLDTKDKYAVFFGGNFGRIDITNESSDAEKLLIVKDSFANCFVPFLTDSYSQITMLDLRYFSGSVKSVSKDFDTVLFLYEISNFAQDTDFIKIIM